MREFLQGYKGSNRKFMAPVSESKFNADVMEFKDTNNNRVPFQMANEKGYATKNADVISLGDGNHRYNIKRRNYKLYCQLAVLHSFLFLHFFFPY